MGTRVTIEELAELSKAELLALIERMNTRHFYGVQKIDVLTAREEVAREKANASFRAYTDARMGDLDKAYSNALTEYMEASRSGSEREFKKKEAALNKAQQERAARERQVASYYAAYKRFDAQADALWKQIDAVFSEGCEHG